MQVIQTEENIDLGKILYDVENRLTSLQDQINELKPKILKPKTVELPNDIPTRLSFSQKLRLVGEALKDNTGYTQSYSVFQDEYLKTNVCAIGLLGVKMHLNPYYYESSEQYIDAVLRKYGFTESEMNKYLGVVKMTDNLATRAPNVPITLSGIVQINDIAKWSFDKIGDWLIDASERIK